MKIFALIFALYTLALSFAPCCDINEGLRNIPQAFQESHEHHNQDSDLCSPFCQCNCCHTFIALHFVKDNSLVPGFSKMYFSHYIEKFPSSIAITHWQPPRLG